MFMGETFVKTFSVDDHHYYSIKKVVNMTGQVFYKAEPLNRGVHRFAETQTELENILKNDINPPRQMASEFKSKVH